MRPRPPVRARRSRARSRPGARAGGPRVPLVTGYLDNTTNPSTSIRGWPDVPSTLTTSLCDPLAAAVTTSTISAACAELVFVLMVAAVPESSLTVAEPRVGPWVDIQATWKPVNVSVAVFPFTVAKSTDPPLATESAGRVQPGMVYLTALAFSWNSDSLYTTPCLTALVLPAL